MRLGVLSESPNVYTKVYISDPAVFDQSMTPEEMNRVEERLAEYASWVTVK